MNRFHDFQVDGKEIIKIICFEDEKQNEFVMQCHATWGKKVSYFGSTVLNFQRMQKNSSLNLLFSTKEVMNKFLSLALPTLDTNDVWPSFIQTSFPTNKRNLEREFHLCFMGSVCLKMHRTKMAFLHIGIHGHSNVIVTKCLYPVIDISKQPSNIFYLYAIQYFQCFNLNR